MTFSEISNILGDPSIGPEKGLDGLYYMDYFIGAINNQTPEFLISFSAENIDGPTLDAYTKWEAFNYANILM